MRRATITAAAIAIAGPLHSQGFDGRVEIGGLTPVGADEIGRSYSVVTAEEIAARQYTHVADALRSLPGVSVNRAGTVGGTTAVRLRGAEGNHTLVLIDGVEAAAPELGEYDLSGLLASDIARIEVLRGPQSALYGSNAIGGVISITTRAATVEPGFSGRVAAEVADDGSRAANVAVSQRTDRARLGFSAAYRFSGGFDISGDPDGEDDEDENLTFGLDAAYDVTEDVTVSALFRQIDRASDYDPENFGAVDRDGLVTDGDYMRERDEVFGSIGVTARLLGGRVESEFRIDAVEFDDRNYIDGVRTTDTVGRRQFALARATVALDSPFVAAADHTLTFALDWERDAYKAVDPDLVFDPSQLDERTRETLGGVVEYRGRFDNGLGVQASLRHDANDGFADATTWSVGASYALPDGATRIHAAAGAGVQAPTLFDQFGFFPGSFVGNPDLEPEQSFGWDIGVEYRLPNGVIDVTYFNQVLTDEIATVFDPMTFLSTAVNEDGESDRQGLEVASSLSLTERISLGLNYTYLDATDPDGAQEVRRPRHNLGVSVDWMLPNDRTELTLAVDHVAGLVDFDFTAPSFGSERVDLDDYTLVDVAARHRLTDSVDLTARVSNLFDVEHEEVYGYDSMGRTVYLGLAARF